jgi:hypothetical protein
MNTISSQSPSIYVIGNTFRPISSNAPKCKIGSTIVTGAIYNATGKDLTSKSPTF